jgi:hypothetical protein
MKKYCKEECKCTICGNGGHVSYWYSVFCEDCLITPPEIPFSGGENRTKAEFKKQMLDKIMNSNNKKDIEKFEKDLEKEKTYTQKS